MKGKQVPGRRLDGLKPNTTILTPVQGREQVFLRFQHLRVGHQQRSDLSKPNNILAEIEFDNKGTFTFRI